MSGRLDPLEELRSAWPSLEAPAPDRELAGEDPLTRRSVAWLQRAWELHEAPAGSPPVALRPRPLLGWAAAAAVLVLGAAAALWRQEAPGEPGDAAPAVAQHQPEPAPAEEPVVVAVILADRVELQSGPVRLIFLNEPLAPASETNEDDR